MDLLRELLGEADLRQLLDVDVIREVVSLRTSLPILVMTGVYEDFRAIHALRAV